MNFKNITIEDKNIMEEYLLKNPYGICDFSYTNIFIWKDIYKTKYCIYKNFLILKTDNGGLRYLMPLGEGNIEEIFEELLLHLRDKPLKIASVTPHMEGNLKNIFHEKLIISNPDDFCDYIYLSENMINLKGKKLSAKRNHINKFMSLYGDRYEYLEINEGLISECREMNIKWCKARDCDKQGSDFSATMTALDNWKALGLKGGALRVDGEIIAFTLGQPNNYQTFNVIIEKALTHIEGAYAMINREFAAKECINYLYINREEDMGVEGLKKAKLSYYPYLLLKKGDGTIQ